MACRAMAALGAHANVGALLALVQAEEEEEAVRAAAVDSLLQRVLGTTGEGSTHPFELTIVTACEGPPPAAARSKLCFELSPGSTMHGE